MSLCDNCMNYPCTDGMSVMLKSCPAFFPIPKPQTNADRIRLMSDEELTIFLAETSRCSDWCNLYEKCKTKTDRSYSVCLETWNEWLKQEAVDKDGIE